MLRRRNSRLNELLCLVALTLCGFTFAAAQQPTCNLRLDQLPDTPELHGFQMGMTSEEVKAKVPPIRLGRADQFGVLKTTINPSFDPRFDQAAFAGVRTISLDFLDGRLITLWIGYDDTFKWQAVNDFIDGIGKSLKLPAAWTPKRDGKQLTCDGFSVFVSAIARSPGIRITDEAAQGTITARREEAAAAAEAAELTVIGDKRTKFYYPSDCDALRSVAESNRVTFKDKEEAEKVGYKLAKDCQ